MKLIAGLGNPGLNYFNTRHNVGFEAIDKFISLHKINMSVKFKSLIAIENIAGEKIIIAKPQTYMNLSGEAILQICSFYKIELSDVIIIHDDIDIELGKIKIKQNGSSGGHNGIKNIILHLGTENFNRIRIGIGKKPEQLQLNDFVLGKFFDSEKVLIDEAINKTCEAIEFIMQENILAAMNKYNTRKGV